MKKCLALFLGGALVATQPMVLNMAQAAAVKNLTVQGKASLAIGDYSTLSVKNGSAKVAANQLVFSSSDPLTAEVDANGKIFASGGGKTTITVKTKAGNAVGKIGISVKKPSPATFSIIAGATTPPTSDNIMYKLIKDKFNITFKISYFVGSEDEKRGVMIASGDYPDLVHNSQKFIDAGAEIPLDPLINKYAPLLKKHYAPYYAQLKDQKSGHLYYLCPNGVVYGKGNFLDMEGTGFFVQKAVLAEAGYPKITTLDEYVNLLKKYKAKHPTIDGKPTIGYEIESYDWRNFGLVNPAQFLAGYPNDGNVIVNQKTYKAQIFADKDIMKRFIKKLNDMNAQGLIDPETFLLNHDQYIAKLSAGNVLGFSDQKWNINDANNSLQAQKKYDKQYIGLPLVFDKSIKPHYVDAAEVNISNGMSITKSCKDPVRLIKFFNALLTESWQKRIQWGEKGKDYLVDKNGMFYRTPAMRTEQNNQEKFNPKHNAVVITNDGPHIEGHYSDGNACSAAASEDELYAGYNSYDKAFLGHYGIKCFAALYGEQPQKNPPYYPCWNITIDSKSEANSVITKIKDTQMQQLPKVIMAKPAQFESMWKAYTAMFKKINVKSYEKVIDEGIQWRLSHWKN